MRPSTGVEMMMAEMAVEGLCASEEAPATQRPTAGRLGGS